MENKHDYHDLHVQSDKFLLSNTFGNFQNMCHKICQLDPGCFLTAPGLVWRATLKKTKVELEALTEIDMLLMVEICIRDGICHANHCYTEANNKYMKGYDKNNVPFYLTF